MKTITKKYKVYNFEELSPEAKETALENYNEDLDYPFLTDDLTDLILEELKEKGLKVSGEITPYYSLSHCQGDGLMFEATLEDKKGNIFTVKHSGFYSHERSTNISGTDQEGNEIDTTDFEENIYIPICIRAAKNGYDILEYEGGEENFKELCQDNGWTFLADGTMFNA